MIYKAFRKVLYAILYPFLFIGCMLDLAYLKWECRQREKRAKVKNG